MTFTTEQVEAERERFHKATARLGMKCNSRVANERDSGMFCLWIAAKKDALSAPVPPVATVQDELEAFEAWWEQHGQYCRAGGGDYEKTFAYRAWQAASQARAAQSAPGAVPDGWKLVPTEHAVDRNAWDKMVLAVRRAMIDPGYNDGADIEAAKKWNGNTSNLIRQIIAAAPSAPIAAQEPVAWTPGMNEFKNWCANYFGPDADDDYLAKAVFDLPPMAQRFARTAPPAQQAGSELPLPQPMRVEFERPHGLCELFYYTADQVTTLQTQARRTGYGEGVRKAASLVTDAVLAERILDLQSSAPIAASRQAPSDGNALLPAVLALNAAIHNVLIAGDDSGDELSDYGLREDLKQAQYVAFRALISIGIERLPGAVNPLSAFLPKGGAA